MSRKTTGYVLASTGAALWGTSGVAVQYLFQHTAATATWLVGIRLLSAGMLLVIFSLVTQPHATRRLFSHGRTCGRLLLYAIFGMGGSQLTYFNAVRYSNAPTATVIEYLAPVLIIGYLALRQRTWPRRQDCLAILIALTGTLILVTHGQLTRLALSPAACGWGFLAAATEAANTLMPIRLFRRFGLIPVVGWSMLLSGSGFIPRYFVLPSPHITLLAGLVIGYIVLAGTLLAYTLYLASVTYIPASTTGMLEAFEPLVATLLAVGWLATPFGFSDLLGSGLIILAVSLQFWPHPHS